MFTFRPQRKWSSLECGILPCWPLSCQTWDLLHGIYSQPSTMAKSTASGPRSVFSQPVHIPQLGLVAHQSGILLNCSENRRITRAARYHWSGAEAAHSSTSSPDAVAYVTLLHRRPLQKARCSSFPRFPRQTSSSFLETSFRFHDVQSRPCSEGSGRGGAVFRQAEGGSAGPAVTGAGHVEAPPAASLLPFRALRG